jgi:hypothetical protein
MVKTRDPDLESPNDAANKITLKKRRGKYGNSPRFAYSLGHCLFILLYWVGNGNTKIHKIEDDSKIKKQTNLDRRGLKSLPFIFHLLDPPSFSLPTTFKAYRYKTR